MTRMIGLDFETYSGCDLLKHGLHQYVNDPTFQPLIAAVAHENMSVDLFDFVEDMEGETERLFHLLDGKRIVAHNAGFEQSVLERMGIDIPSSDFVDSAVLARAAGAAGKLEAAAPQLLGTDKLAMGYDLIKLFSIPGEYQKRSGNQRFDPAIRVDEMKKWEDFAYYCAVDAQLSLQLALQYPVSESELGFNAVTMDMNNTGWHVDMTMVLEMQRRYLDNVDLAVAEFRLDTGADELNLNSHPQLKAWCGERGVRASSFDEAHVASLIKRLDKRMSTMDPQDPKWRGYDEVLKLLHTKQVMGGSSLKKLATIIDTIGTDGRLHDQYLHIGAGATFRTTGRGVQMQNLKRLNGEGDDMLELFDEANQWDNNKLATNLRQVFTASDPDGFLIVGDFSSVESRGLAWQAGEEWKLDAYRNGRDVYKELAVRKFGKPVDQITKPERTFGKVGELSCGYGAGPDAVREFAKNMGVDLSEGESVELVKDWRDADPRTVQYWQDLNDAMHHAIERNRTMTVLIPHGVVDIEPVPSPESLLKQDQEVVSLEIRMYLSNGSLILTRVIHGCKIVGRNIQYYKPSERKTGDLWSDEFVNPKTKRLQKHSVYGGKLAGLLTQSLCREVFMHSLRKVSQWIKDHPGINIQLIGQFHDEIVLEWTPGPLSLESAKAMLNTSMSSTTLPGFPLAAEIKSDYRYTK